MNLKIILYVLLFFLTAYVLMGTRLNEFFKQGRVLQAKIAVILISMCVSYLASEFIINFLELTKVI